MTDLLRGSKATPERQYTQRDVIRDSINASQWSESRGCQKTDLNYGGTGPNEQSCPDLLHTAQMLEALRMMGVPANDPYIQRAVDFVSRCQRLDAAKSRSIDGDERVDGGFALGPIDPSSRSTDVATAAERPCGLATAMGITSLLAAGVAHDDIRVRGGFQWLKTHYSLDVHPGMARPHERLYRYYYEFAKAMRALGVFELQDGRGVGHDWRVELEQRLISRQRPDGSWSNPEESPETARCSPVIITGYALLALEEIRESREARGPRRQGAALVRNVSRSR